MEMWIQEENKNNEISDYYMIDDRAYVSLYWWWWCYQPILISKQLYFKMSIFTKSQKSHLPLFKFEIKKLSIILKLCKKSLSLRLF